MATDRALSATLSDIEGTYIDRGDRIIFPRHLAEQLAQWMDRPEIHAEGEGFASVSWTPFLRSPYSSIPATSDRYLFDFQSLCDWIADDCSIESEANLEDAMHAVEDSHRH